MTWDSANFGYSPIAPCSMDEQKARQELELTDGEIRCPNGLHSFVAGNGHPYICLLQHRNVVGPIADR